MPGSFGAAFISWISRSVSQIHSSGVDWVRGMQDEHKTQIREWVAQRGTPVQFYQATQNKNKFEVTVEEVP